MRPIPSAYSAYTRAFRCIGPACEDTCCQGWNVPIDQAAYEKYQNLPASPLRTLITGSITKNIEQTPTAVCPGNARFAQILINSAEH